MIHYYQVSFETIEHVLEMSNFLFYSTSNFAPSIKGSVINIIFYFIPSNLAPEIKGPAINIIFYFTPQIAWHMYC